MNQKEKNQQLTREYLDRAMEKQAVVILKAVDVKIDKSSAENREYLDRALAENREYVDNALAEQSMSILEAVSDGFEELKQKIEETRNLLDGYVKDQEDFKQEFTIVDYKVRKIEKVIKKELSVEI